MSEKLEQMSAVQIRFLYHVAMAKVEQIERELTNEITPDERQYAHHRMAEIYRWLGVLKTKYIEAGNDAGDIPF